MNKLHIGCGKKYFPGWVNVDACKDVKADVYADALSLPFENETFDLIYACHILEHVKRFDVEKTLSHWRDLLKTGGVLRLAVPDFQAIHFYYHKNGGLKTLMGLLYGGQDTIFNEHHVIFDYSTLLDHLKAVGFIVAREWDWRYTEHSQFDDFSQAYLPHMDKERGMLMSLNLEAVK